MSMSPAESPSQLRRGTGTRRLRKWPLVFFVVLFSAAITILVTAGNRNTVRASAPPETVIANVEAADPALAGVLADPLKPIVPKDVAAPQKNSGVIVPIVDVESPPLPSGEDNGVQKKADGEQPKPERIDRANTKEEDDARKEIMKWRMDEFRKALTDKAPSIVVTSLTGRRQPTAGGVPTKSEMLAQINQARAAAAGAETDMEKVLAIRNERIAEIKGRGAATGGSSGRSKVVAMADGQGESGKWDLASELNYPRTPFVLRAGHIIPAKVQTGLNSELKGQCLGVVAQDVMDTATGRYLLIPQGTKVYGLCAHEVAFGQERLMTIWQRLVFPDGKALDIGGMGGSDSAGYAGFKDQVNNHYLRTFGSAVLLSFITGGISYSQQKHQGSTSEPTAGSAMSEALGQQLGQVTAQLITKNMNVAPNLEIRPGYEFNIIANKDMVFESPYESFDYQE